MRLVAYTAIAHHIGRDIKEKMLLAVSALITTVMAACLLRLSRYGIDFTDESFYLV